VAAGVGQVLALEIKSRTAGERAELQGAAVPALAH